MSNHALGPEDHAFRAAFEGCAMRPEDFGHREHIQLAYVYLVENETEAAFVRVREALLRFLDHHRIPAEKYHETLTRAWLLAVRLFMAKSPSSSAADFIERNPLLLDSKIMLTHYSAALLFSPEARASFVPPDLDPIPNQQP